MKKKGIIVLLVCLVMACSIVLSSCSLVKVNEERQANRVLATVTVNLVDEFGDGVKVLGDDWNYEVTLNVTRRELISTVNYVINYYTQMYQAYGYQYNYELEALMESSLKSMITQKYQAISAIGELLLKAPTTGRLGAMYCETAEYQTIYGKTIVPEGVLTMAERYGAVKKVNDQFGTQLDTYMEGSSNDELDREKSDANYKLGELYLDGYFVEGISIAKKVVTDEGTTYEDGLYTLEVVDDNDDNTKDLDATKLYAKMELKKGDDVKYVYMPVDETEMTLADATDADFAGKYVTVKTVTVKASGRVYAEVTDDNPNGYEIESFTSDAINYNLIKARSVYKAADDEEDNSLESLRYVTIAKWKDTENYTELMTDAKADIFNPSPDKYADNVEKDAYRQIRNMLKSNNIGYSEEDPGTDSINYVSYKYYNGMKYYYDSQFQEALMSAIEYELSANTTVSADDVLNEYNVLVLKDKANYDGLSYTAQVKKFFETIKTDLSKAYYVPIDALVGTTFEVDPTEKAYKSLFTFDASQNVTGYSSMITEDDGKYKMAYAYENANNTYTINMFYVGHILLSFDNVDGLADMVKSITADYTDEQKLMFIQLMSEYIKTNPQLASYLDNYDKEKVYGSEDVFGETEDINTVLLNITTALSTAYDEGDYESFLGAFKAMMTVYNDDSGSLSGSGYLISVGDMENGWYADFTATGTDLYFNLMKKYGIVIGSKNDTIELDDLTSKAYTDYGVHIMYICFAPLQNVTIDANGGIGLNTKLDIDGKTWSETISDSLLTTKKSNEYSAWQAKITEDTINKHTVKNEKNYKRMVDDLVDKK